MDEHQAGVQYQRRDLVAERAILRPKEATEDRQIRRRALVPPPGQERSPGEPRGGYRRPTWPAGPGTPGDSTARREQAQARLPPRELGLLVVEAGRLESPRRTSGVD